MKRRLIAFLVASALMVAAAAPALANHSDTHGPQGCENSSENKPTFICENYE